MGLFVQGLGVLGFRGLSRLQAEPKTRVRALGLLGLVKAFNLSHHWEETLLFSIDLYHGNLN